MFLTQDKFYQENQNLKQKKLIPAPGSYDINKFKQSFKAAKFSIAPRLKENNKNNKFPGPASYSASPTHSQSPRIIMNKSPRIKDSKSKSPGPGDYMIPKTNLLKNKPESTMYIFLEVDLENVGNRFLQQIILDQDPTTLKKQIKGLDLQF